MRNRLALKSINVCFNCPHPSLNLEFNVVKNRLLTTIKSSQMTQRNFKPNFYLVTNKKADGMSWVFGLESKSKAMNYLNSLGKKIM